jgi:hypothetical protein
VSGTPRKMRSSSRAPTSPATTPTRVSIPMARRPRSHFSTRRPPVLARFRARSMLWVPAARRCAYGLVMEGRCAITRTATQRLAAMPRRGRRAKQHQPTIVARPTFPIHPPSGQVVRAHDHAAIRTVRPGWMPVEATSADRKSAVQRTQGGAGEAGRSPEAASARVQARSGSRLACDSPPRPGTMRPTPALGSSPLPASTA